MLEIDRLIDVLKDGKWHPLTEMFEKCELSVIKVKRVLEFLSEYEFVEVDMEGRRVKLAPSLLRFILKVEP